MDLTQRVAAPSQLDRIKALILDRGFSYQPFRFAPDLAVGEGHNMENGYRFGYGVNDVYSAGALDVADGDDGGRISVPEHFGPPDFGCP